MQIKTLFDAGNDIYRTIEKVINYGAAQEERLKAEVSEYVVTDSIDEQMHELLNSMQLAMGSDGHHEVGVWVSGFYGSGKSSFTKYLGFAMDDAVTIDGQPFRNHLQNRFKGAQTKALFNTLARKFPAAVVMLDLATEQAAGASLEEVSTVLYYKVLRWAGYSRNLKVAAFERRLQQDSKYENFLKLFAEATGGEEWQSYQNDELVIDSVLPELAHQLYPDLFRTTTSFNTETRDTQVLLNERIEEILQIVRDHSGKDHVLFVIDEIGQYVGSNQNKILDLQGFAENLKNIGEGKAWIIGTAQQTLTEDDPRAAINSPELYKLKDRFPIQVDLVSSDIREICIRRLLGKSPEGRKTLAELFQKHGQALRHNTKLENARFYDAELNEATFVDLYPFLPAHFDILLHLLGALAKSTGGIGLRSAIKVLQDILIEQAGNRKPVADRPVGWLATTVTLFEALEKDIERAFPTVFQAVQRAVIHYDGETLHQNVARTIGLLQIMQNLPVTTRNVAALLHDSVESSALADDVQKAVDDMLKEPIVPLMEKEDRLQFISERMTEIDQERAQLPLRTSETRRILNEALRDCFDPIPSAQVEGSLSVRTGLKAVGGGYPTSLAGERESIQTVIELVDADEFDTARRRLEDQSRESSSNKQIFLLARHAPEAEEKVTDIFRCRGIAEKYRNDPDQDIRDYCQSQSERATRLANQLQQTMRRALTQGVFIFRGRVSAVETLDQNLVTACRKHLADAASEVFDHFAEAPVRAETTLAERFLSQDNLNAVDNKLDPLGFVQKGGGTPSVNVQQKAIVSVRDYVDRNGTVEGKRLADHFQDAPYGWSPDTLRYILAAMLTAGEIKLKVSGREVTARGQQAIDALKTNNAFKNVGVSLRHDRPSMEVLSRASERLTELTGEPVVPLEDEVSKAAAKELPKLQTRYASLGERLRRLKLPGAQRVESLQNDIEELLLTDGSDAPSYFGGEESRLFDNILWAKRARKALDDGLANTVEAFRKDEQAIKDLPVALREQLTEACDEQLATASRCLETDDFAKRTADLNTALTSIENAVSNAVDTLQAEQQKRLREAEQSFSRIPEWTELTQDEQAAMLERAQRLAAEAEGDIDGLERLVMHEMTLQRGLNELSRNIVDEGRDRVRKRLDIADKKGTHKRSVKLPARIESMTELTELIQKLERARNELRYFEQFELTLDRDD